MIRNVNVYPAISGIGFRWIVDGFGSGSRFQEQKEWPSQWIPVDPNGSLSRSSGEPKDQSSAPSISNLMMAIKPTNAGHGFATRHWHDYHQNSIIISELPLPLSPSSSRSMSIGISLEWAGWQRESRKDARDDEDKRAKMRETRWERLGSVYSLSLSRSPSSRAPTLSFPLSLSHLLSSLLSSTQQSLASSRDS